MSPAGAATPAGPPGAGPTPQAPGTGRDRRRLLVEMLRIRRFEERCVELYSAGAIRGFVHLYIGEEAAAVGVMGWLTPDDAVVATYREHGHALARGIPAAAVMAEMYGKVEGTSRGRGGSMHLFDVSRRFYGATPSSAAGCRWPGAWAWRISSRAGPGSPPASSGRERWPRGSSTRR